MTFDLEQYRRNMEDFCRRYPSRPGFMLCLDGTYERVPAYQPRARKDSAWPAWAQKFAMRVKAGEFPPEAQELVLKLLAEYLERG